MPAPTTASASQRMPLAFHVVFLMVAAMVIVGFLVRLPGDGRLRLDALRRHCPNRSVAYPHYYPDCNIDCAEGEVHHNAVIPLADASVLAHLEFMQDHLGRHGPLASIPSRPHISLGYFCCQKKEDIPVIDRVLQAHPWGSQRIDIRLQPHATCEADGYNTASILWSVDAPTEERLQALQGAVEQAIEAQGVRLRRHRRAQQGFHVTVASVKENQYSTLPGIQQLNAWLGDHPFLSSFSVTSPCFHTGRLKCLDEDNVEQVTRLRALGILPPADVQPHDRYIWEAFDWGEDGTAVNVLIRAGVFFGVAVALSSAASHNAFALLHQASATIAAMASMALCCVYLDLHPIKQLMLFGCSAGANLLALVVYYFLFRAARDGVGWASPTLFFVAYLGAFVLDYGLDLRHSVTVFRVALSFATYQVLGRIRTGYVQRGEDPTPLVKALLGLELVLCGASAATWVAYFADWDRAIVWGLILVSEALLATKVMLTGLQLHAKASEQQVPREDRA